MYMDFCLNWRQCKENVHTSDIFTGCFTSSVGAVNRDSLESILTIVISNVFAKMPAAFDRIPDKETMPYYPSKPIHQIRLALIAALVEAISPMSMAQQAVNCLSSLEDQWEYICVNSNPVYSFTNCNPQSSAVSHSCVVIHHHTSGFIPPCVY